MQYYHWQSIWISAKVFLITSFALVDFLSNVLDALDRKEITIGLFLDLSKAFDSLDHHILLDKLYCYGFRGIVHKWFKSYLSNRKQWVLQVMAVNLN